MPLLILAVLPALLLLLISPTPSGRAQPTPAYDPASFTLHLRPVASGLSRPVGVTHAPDGTNRLFVVQKGGSIAIVQDGRVLPTPFLDLTPIVGSAGSEQGLLGLAFHPRYLENGLFFVNYTNLNGDTVIARYQVSADPNVADPGTGKLLLHVPQPYANHNGGHLLFGPDGYLWIGLGDGGSAGDPHNNAQNGLALLGKLLRLDVDAADPYLSPPDNPFVNASDVWPEVWALGLRNPWRYSFDRLTGDLYIADVGQGSLEEVNVQPAGAGGGQNYGWSHMEGSRCFRGPCDPAGLVLPIGEYDHSLGCSVTGGHVYRGAFFPALWGAYFFGDFCSGRIWSLHRAPDGAWIQTELRQTPVRISAFGEDAAGELYLTDFSAGALYRLEALPLP